jgi:SAM-dependent methyltransferase
MLELLCARARREGLDIETRVMDGHSLTLDDESFDLVGSQFGVMLFPDMPQGIREMARVAKSGGRVLMTVYGDPHEIEFFGFFVTAIQSVRPDFTGPPLDPPPLPFQLQNPERLRNEMASAGLRKITVETLTETTQFESGSDLWDWLVCSNPIVGSVLAGLDLMSAESGKIEGALEDMVRERAGGTGAACLTNPINIAIGTKELT